jgi:biotin synthase
MKNSGENSSGPFADGQTLNNDEAMRILRATGSDFTYLMAGAQRLREKNFGNGIDLCSIINAKSGRCAENCAFCAQSAHHQTETPVYPLKTEEEIVAGARRAAEEGNHCYGIVTSGTGVTPGEEFDRILSAIRVIRKAGLISPSASLGILSEEQAEALAEAGCVTYHHNLETARSFFPQICTTHAYDDDVATVRRAKQAGMQVCCGGIFGLGESLEQRVELAMTLRELDVDSVPINFLNPVPGTRLENLRQLTPMDCLRIITLFRYLLPAKRITVCGGREPNLRELQSWMFMAGASGTMVGNYLTTSGRERETDLQMFVDTEVVINACK